MRKIQYINDILITSMTFFLPRTFFLSFEEREILHANKKIENENFWILKKEIFF